jgi:proteasome lid subunit RPN8/RPN11
VGFILPDDELVEVQNTSDEPEKSFDVSGDDIVRYADTSVATWHTHPISTSNLSVGDYETFLMWPKHRHLIIGTDGITEYYVEDGEVLIA